MFCRTLCGKGTFLVRGSLQKKRRVWPNLVGAFKVVLAGSRLGKPGVLNGGLFGVNFSRFSLGVSAGFFLIRLLSFLAFRPVASWSLGLPGFLADWLLAFLLSTFWLYLFCGFGLPASSAPPVTPQCRRHLVFCFLVGGFVPPGFCIPKPIQNLPTLNQL